MQLFALISHLDLVRSPGCLYITPYHTIPLLTYCLSSLFFFFFFPIYSLPPFFSPSQTYARFVASLPVVSAYARFKYLVKDRYIHPLHPPFTSLLSPHSPSFFPLLICLPSCGGSHVTPTPTPLPTTITATACPTPRRGPSRSPGQCRTGRRGGRGARGCRAARPRRTTTICGPRPWGRTTRSSSRRPGPR